VAFGSDGLFGRMAISFSDRLPAGHRGVYSRTTLGKHGCLGLVERLQGQPAKIGASPTAVPGLGARTTGQRSLLTGRQPATACTAVGSSC